MYRLLVHRSLQLSSNVCRLHPSPRILSQNNTISLNRRRMSTPPPQLNSNQVSMERYHTLSDTTMDALLDALEGLLDRLGNSRYEVEYHSGVLTLNLADKGTYVINKQPPNKQIWLSSPFSGPKRYDYALSSDSWVYARDGRALGVLLEEELHDALGVEVSLGLEVVSENVIG